MQLSLMNFVSCRFLRFSVVEPPTPASGPWPDGPVLPTSVEPLANGRGSRCAGLGTQTAPWPMLCRRPHGARRLHRLPIRPDGLTGRSPPSRWALSVDGPASSVDGTQGSFSTIDSANSKVAASRRSARNRLISFERPLACIARSASSLKWRRCPACTKPAPSGLSGEVGKWDRCRKFTVPQLAAIPRATPDRNAGLAFLAPEIASS
jgi:hypothetical protein